MDENVITSDVEIKPNYIPPVANHSDYIQDYQTNEHINDNYQNSMKNQDVMDDIYDELQTPIIVMLVYFLLQLPAFKKYERRFIPGLFGSDTNINTYGVVFNSVFIGLFVFLIRRLVQNI